MKEIWKDIKGLEGLYQVSNLGNVMKIDRCDLPYVLKQHLNHKGYHRVMIMVNGKHYCYRVHRLVAEYFIPNPENKPQVNHIDGNKDNNRVDNLEWCTDEENKIHANKNNLSNLVPIALLRNGIEVARYNSITQAIKETNKKYRTPCQKYTVIKEDNIYVIYQWVRV